MESTVQLVATVASIKRLLPTQFAKRYAQQLEAHPDFEPAGPVSGGFPIDAAACETKFGRWLAETVGTTRFDDDFSRLHLTTRYSEEDLHVRTAFERFGRNTICCQGDFDRFQAQMLAWLDERKRSVQVFGESSFAAREFDFRWPVFGSAVVKEALTPEAYFDLCAKLIRQHNPIKVVHLASRSEPPESLKVTCV